MTRKQTIILIALIVFIAGGVVFGFANRKNKKTAENSSPEETPPSNQTAGNSKNYYTAEVPKNAELTKPEREFKNQFSGNSETYKFFNLAISEKGYEPAEITVKKNDSVTIEITAVDGDRDFFVPTLGLYQVAKKGETKLIVFEAITPGVYSFGCRAHCPVSGTTKGKIIILQ